MSKHLDIPTSKECLCCGGEFHRRYGLSGRQWSKQVHCSHRCVNLHKKRDPLERFWQKVNIRGADDCWEWVGGRNEQGYGLFSPMDGSRPASQKAHRFIWTHAKGPIPQGMLVMHKCDNPPCVNPAHLQIGTHLDNRHDCINKGRAVALRGSNAPRAQVAESDVLEMRRMRAGGASYAQIARAYSVQYHAAWNAINKRTWAWLGE